MHVRERQAMVFNGDWNGGERVFNLRPGQRVALNSITRIDTNGTSRVLERGNLDEIDQFDWTSASTLRWRSRRPNDFIFDNKEIVYELDYVLSNILNPEAEQYTLDHDFSFPDRSGVIESFALDFDVADVWQSTSPLPLRIERANMEPGTSFVVTMSLQYAGAGQPSGVLRGMSLLTRLILALSLLGIFGAMVQRFFAGERARGRFEPLIPVETIDETWLRKHVFSMPPEVVGAIWDSKTASPEVAAMIARMVMEGKLASRIESEGRKDVLHLELKVRRADLEADERRLINALFDSGRDTTDTERIKRRYSSSGFDPAALIGEGIQKRIKALRPDRKTPRSARGVMINILVVMIVAAAGVRAILLAEGSPAMLTPMITGGLGLVALVLAGVYRADVVDTLQRARIMVFFLAIAAAYVLSFILGFWERGAALALAPVVSPAHVGMPFAAAMMAMFLGIVFLVLRGARTNVDPDRLELRRTLAAGRAFFMRELARPQPSLDDAWYPYLLAFGLGKHIDQWFRAFGGAHERAATSASGMAIASSSMSSTGGWSGGGPQFSGGGGFGGGGAGRTWATAVSGMAAGVAAPCSSSSGGGGGGGGGSSGGGGGGGW